MLLGKSQGNGLLQERNPHGEPIATSQMRLPVSGSETIDKADLIIQSITQPGMATASRRIHSPENGTLNGRTIERRLIAPESQPSRASPCLVSMNRTMAVSITIQIMVVSIPPHRSMIAFLQVRVVAEPKRPGPAQ